MVVVVNEVGIGYSVYRRCFLQNPGPLSRLSGICALGHTELRLIPYESSGLAFKNPPLLIMILSFLISYGLPLKINWKSSFSTRCTRVLSIKGRCL